ncbi:MAG: response regulator [Acidobacteria bacterium]|nr:response regulator [Acidobacteriota bacterium]
MPLNAPVILLVDDHPDSVEMYTVGLLAMGFQPLSAANADDAFARACECQPDVIVADVAMPGASGFELTRRLRGHARTKDAGIILLTGHALDSARQEAAAAGADRFLLKPCLPEELALEIRDVIAHRRPVGQ